MPQSNTQHHRARWWDGLLCGCIVVLAILSTFPFAETGFDDDFSYIKTAQIFSHTGHFVYNGWATAMLGWQIPWGALFIKLFGFSFTAARLSILPIVLATMWVFFAVLVRFGVTRRHAWLGTLMLGLCPVFFPLATSFMTDTSGTFIIILCIYLCQRTVDASNAKHAILWLVAATATNVIGGTARQIAWLGILVVVPSTAWMLRARFRILPAGVALWALGSAVIFACLHWWSHQPYYLAEPLFVPAGFFHTPLRTTTNIVREVLCLSVVAFPLIVAWYRSIPTQRPRVLVGVVFFAALFQFFNFYFSYPFYTFPWLRDVIGDLGIRSDFGWMLGNMPTIFSPAVITLISWVIVLFAFLFFTDLYQTARTVVSNARSHDNERDASSWHSMLWILVPYSVCYILLLIPRGLFTEIADRYLLGIIPVAIILLLRLYQDRFRQPLPAVTYVVVFLFAVLSIGGTHDLYSMHRARLRAASVLTASGIPQEQVQQGIDHDGWLQIERTGTLNEPRLRIPTGSYHLMKKPDLPEPCLIWSWRLDPVIQPRYFVNLSPVACFADTSFRPVEYTAWLPPFHRALYIQALR